MTRLPISFIATSDPAAARAFYETVLGLNLIETSPYALVFMDGPNMLRVQIVPDHTPPPYTVHGWQVGDIAHEVQALAAKGIPMQTFEQLNQDDLGIWTTAERSKIAWFKDPSGNILSFTQIAKP